MPSQERQKKKNSSITGIRTPRNGDTVDLVKDLGILSRIKEVIRKKKKTTVKKIKVGNFTRQSEISKPETLSRVVAKLRKDLTL